ncbi:transcription antiterminator NusG [Kaistia terrae]|nr:transcription termination/antitermination NusG family protein [Kaistia terrae]MCX5576716.1 transcription antiterminator NusG [Kaistia terrae]
MPLPGKVRNEALGGFPRSSQSGRRWYVAASQPGREDVALLNLGRQGFVSWLPRQRRMVRHARKAFEKSVAFFPGYIFVSLDLAADRWHPINSTIGVRSLIMQGGRPMACPSGLIEGMQILADSSGVMNEQQMLAEGSQVRVLVGPFAEMIGTLTRAEGAGRVRVLLDLMQTQVAIQMDARDLTASY